MEGEDDIVELDRIDTGGMFVKIVILEKSRKRKLRGFSIKIKKNMKNLDWFNEVQANVETTVERETNNIQAEKVKVESDDTEKL